MKEKKKSTTTEKECNCQASRKKDCPVNGKCNRRNVIYTATTQNADPHFYIGVTENFKPRWYHHKQAFKNPEKLHCLIYIHVGQKPGRRA